MLARFSNRPVSEQSREEHQMAGRKGGLARSYVNDNDNDEDMDMETSPAKRPRSSGSNSNNTGKMTLSEAGRKGGQARAQKAGQNTKGYSGTSRRGDDFDPDSDKYGYDENDRGDFNDGIAMHTRSHDDNGSDDNGNNYSNTNTSKSNNRKNLSNSNSKRSSTYNNRHTDFSSGKNPNRQAASRAAARERGHQAFVEMGRKGGHSNAGIHADMDFDDMESFKSTPESGLPAKNPNRVRGGKQAAEKRGHDELSEMGRMGGQSNLAVSKFRGSVDMGENDEESFNERDSKSPNRVQGGKRGAAKQSHQSFVERGRIGGQARARAGQINRNNNNNEDQDDDIDEPAETRARTGTQSQWQSKSNNRGRQSQSQYDEDDDNQNMDDDDNDNVVDNEGKNPNRVRGGKQAASHFTHEELSERAQRAAETRAIHGTQSHSGSRPQSQSKSNNRNNNSGNNKHRRSTSNNSNNNGNDDDDEDDDNFDDMNRDDFEAGDEQGGKNPNRVRGGRQAASHFTHEELSERARRAAETRAIHGTQSHSGSRPKNERYNDNMDLEDQDDDNDNIIDDDDNNDSQDGKNPNRVRGGQKAAQTRLERGTQSHSGSRSQSQSNNRSSNRRN